MGLGPQDPRAGPPITERKGVTTTRNTLELFAAAAVTTAVVLSHHALRVICGFERCSTYLTCFGAKRVFTVLLFVPLQCPSLPEPTITGLPEQRKGAWSRVKLRRTIQANLSQFSYVGLK